MDAENLEIIPGEDDIIPGTGKDLFLYLVSGFGLFLLASLIVGVFVQEINQLLIILAILLNIIILSGTVYLLGIRQKKISWKMLGISPPIWEWKYLGIAVGLVLFITPIRAVIGIAVQMLLEGNLDSVLARGELLGAGGFTLPNFIITLVGVGILAPISEELYFRGLLHNWFRQRMNMNSAVVFSSALFGIAHMDSLGVLVASFIMGVVIAIAYEKTKTLWMAIAIHVITNSIAVLLLFLAQAIEEYLPEII